MTEPQHHNILVIDDSAAARAAVAAVLQAAGYGVYERDTAVGAVVDIIRYDIDAVVVDLNMPLMDGTRFVEVLRQSTTLDSVLVVLFTGQDDREALAARGKACGADLVLMKTELMAELVPFLEQSFVEGRGRITWQKS